MPVNIRNNQEIKTLSENILNCVEDYKYLGSHIKNSEKDLNIRKGIACIPFSKLDKVWKSNLDRKFKIQIFRVLVEPILLYGSETWTLSAKQQQCLDGCCTRLLRSVHNLSWQNHPTLETIYEDLPRVSNLVYKRRVQFAGHCARATDELVSSFVLWRHPSSENRSRKLTFPDRIRRDTTIPKENLLAAMKDREYWKDVVSSISAEAAR